MKQFKLTFVLTVLMSMVGLQAFAVFDTSTKVEVGGLYYYLDNDNSQAQVTSMPEGYYSGDIEIIPNIKYGGKTYSVKSIGEMAFYNCSGLTSVAIGKRVSSIGESAFSGCSGLTSVTLNSNDIASKAYTSSNNIKNIFGEQVKEYIIGEDVTSIGAYAFDGCSKLTSVTIGNSVTSIGENAFNGCSKLTSVTIGNSVTSIGSEAFRNCSGLTSVTIGNSVTSIGKYAFRNCSGLTSVTIGNSVTSIGISAFYGCSKLTSVTLKSNAIFSKTYTKEVNIKSIFGEQVTEYIIGDDVTSIGDNAFYGCTGLTSVTIGNSVTSIGGYAFRECSGLTSVTIGNSVTSIGDYAFYCCSKLTSVTIPNSVTSIGNWAFYGCSGLTSVTIGNSVTSIGDNAFRECSKLTSVTIGNSVTSIGVNAFYRCSGLKKVIVKDIAAWCGISFKNYDENPLYYAKHLYSDDNTEITDLVIPDGVTSIGERAFLGCDGLTSVTIGNSVTSIGNSAFWYCYGLTSITIPNSVTSIDESAFQYCSGLKKVIVKDIAAWCKMSFRNEFANPLYYAHHLYSDENTEVKDLVIPDGVTSIGGGAFWYCSGLTSVTIPNSVTSIGNYAFQDCSGLKKVIVKDIAAWCGIKIYYASDNPLYYAKHLYSDDNTEITDLVIPDGVTSIGGGAFWNCDGLTSVTIPNSVTSIGSSAFRDCSNLESVTALNPTPVTINQNTFTNRENATLYVPKGSKDAYKAANYWKEFMEIVEIETTGIDQISFQENGNGEQVIDQEGAVWYTIDGKQIDKPKKGINIIRMSDGTTRKVLVK